MEIERMSFEELAQFQQELKPELVEIAKLLRRIEQKVGTEDSWRRTAAISQVILLASSSFQNVLVSMLGWADQYPEGVKLHSASTSANIFVTTDQDDALLEIMSLVTGLLVEEKHSLVSSVQNNRAKQSVLKLH